MNSRKDMLRQARDMWLASGHKLPAPAKEMAEWMVARDLYRPKHTSIVNECAAELSEALRDEHFTDPQGRKVRRNHNYKVKRTKSDGSTEQLTIWVMLPNAAPHEMKRAFATQRNRILDDCRQLKTDVDSYNENGRVTEAIQLSFDFTTDLEELEASQI